MLGRSGQFSRMGWSHSDRREATPSCRRTRHLAPSAVANHNQRWLTTVGDGHGGQDEAGVSRDSVARPAPVQWNSNGHLWPRPDGRLDSRTANMAIVQYSSGSSRCSGSSPRLHQSRLSPRPGRGRYTVRRYQSARAATRRPLIISTASGQLARTRPPLPRAD